MNRLTAACVGRGVTRWVCVWAGVLLFVSPVFAQDPLAPRSEFAGPLKGQWEFVLGGAGATDGDFDTHAFGVSGSIGRYVEDNLLIGVRHNIHFSDPETGNNDINFSSRLHADIVFRIDSWRPFVGLNFGGIYGEDTNNTLAAGPEVGVKFYVGGNAFLYTLAEYQFKLDNADSTTDAANDGRFFYTIGLGINF